MEKQNSCKKFIYADYRSSRSKEERHHHQGTRYRRNADCAHLYFYRICQPSPAHRSQRRTDSSGKCAAVPGCHYLRTPHRHPGCAFGMGLFDLLSGWYLWAPFTFVIVGFMGFTVGAITEKHHGYGWNALAIAVACVIKVVGYYIAEGFIYGNWIAPATSIPGNLVQIGVAAIIVIPIAERLRITVQKRL